MYYEIEIQINKEGTESKGMYRYESKDKAVAMFHKKQGSGMDNPDLVYVMNMVINEHGGTEEVAYWYAPEPEPEPEVEI